MPMTTQEIYAARAIRSYTNLFYQEDIDFEALDLPEIVTRDLDDPDIEVAERLTKAFCRAAQDGGAKGNGVWERISREYHEEFTQHLLDHDTDAVAKTLAGMFRGKVMHGITSLENSLRARIQIHDTVISLGVASGIIRVRNPVDLATQSLFNYDYREVLGPLADTLKYDLAPPQVGGIFGIEFRGKIISLRQLYQVHTAQRIKMILNKPAASCLEIGGGAGFLAYAAVKMGSAKDYCIIDLPIVNVLQGYLLLKSDLAPYVELYGETPKSGSGGAVRIRLLPDIAMGDLPDQSFDCAINTDSLPEMEESTIRDYLGEIRRVCRDYFLSVNQETATKSELGFVHGRVHDLVKGFPEFRLGSRAPFWPRKGYVEEVFHLNS